MAKDNKELMYYVEVLETGEIKKSSRSLAEINRYITGAYKLGTPSVAKKETLIVRAVPLSQSMTIAGENDPLTRRRVLKRNICEGLSTMFGMNWSPANKNPAHLFPITFTPNNIYQLGVDGLEGDKTNIHIELQYVRLGELDFTSEESFTEESLNKGIIKACATMIEKIIKDSKYMGVVNVCVKNQTVITVGENVQTQKEARTYIDTTLKARKTIVS